VSSIVRWTSAAALLLAGTTGPVTVLRAQEAGWRLTGGASHAWFGGGVADTTGAGLTFGPSPSVAWSLGADHPLGRVRAGLAFSYLATSLQVSGSGVRIVSEDTRLRQHQLAALVSITLLRVGVAGAGFGLSAGPLVDIWTVAGADSRTRAGALAAVSFAAPIAPGWSLLASAAGSLSGSPFSAGELPVEFTPSTLLGGQIEIAVRYGD
jgi:hypothetical protein